jgi:hypothetical protein
LYRWRIKDHVQDGFLITDAWLDEQLTVLDGFALEMGAARVVARDASDA